MRREVLPGGRDDEFGGWCHTHRERPSGARGHGRSRAALARSRRGHDCGRGCFRSRARVSRDGPRRQRAACPRRQGGAARARCHLYGTRGDRALCGGLRVGRGASQARSLRQLPRGGFLPPAAKPRLDHLAQGHLDGAWRDPVRRGDARAAESGRIRRMAARLTSLEAPIFSALGPLLARLPPDRFPRHDDLNALATSLIVSGGGAPIRFVLPAAASGEFSAQYEVRIFETGQVQTRPDNWHDLFNALVWIAFPRTKAVLNRHHCEEIRARRGERLRGTARDVLTLFDEGGIIVAAADPGLPALLREFRWKELFWR